MKIVFAIAAMCLASPAFAQADQGSRAPAIAAPTQPGGATTTRTKETRYCVIDNVTGSRIERKLCRTRQAWLSEGYDPVVDLRK